MILKEFRTQPKGELIRPHVLQLNWPNQSEPGIKGFKVWMKCLKACFNMQSNGNIYHKMGDWNLETVHSTNEWKYTEDQFNQYPIITKQCTSAVVDMNVVPMIYPSLPDHCIPTTITKRSNGLSIARFSKNKVITQAESNVIHLKTLENREKWKHVMTDNIIVLDNQKAIDLISDSEQPIMIFSDGGVHDYHGNFGIVIADGETPIVSNKGQIYSVVFQQSPYRS